MRRKIIAPLDMMGEVLAGVVMALTVSVAVWTASGGKVEPRELVEAVIGCNVAWGLFDGMLYVFGRRAAGARREFVLESLKGTRDAKQLRERLDVLVDPGLAFLVPFMDLEKLRGAVEAGKADPEGGGSEDVLAAVGLGLIEVLSAVPLILPLLFIHPPARAILVSSAIAIVLLAGAGAQVARWSGQSVWLLGVLTPALGAVLVAVCLVLGG